MRLITSRGLGTIWKRQIHSLPTPNLLVLHTICGFHSSSSLLALQLNDYLLNKSPSHLSEARKLHSLLLVAGFFNPNSRLSHLCSRLVHIYVEFGCLEEALFVFHRLPRYQTIACNAILRGYIDSGQFARAINFFFHDLVFKLGFVPDNYTCPLILKACSRLSDLEQGRKNGYYIAFAGRFLGVVSNGMQISTYRGYLSH
ncbi:unnamed protein product [Fraxinus pennsylvanica]|uniref:Pentatricopeptide repeat-containing protein n=1 Tax=Fraxinus pennsylvanica TaxID=56036 RepID=A0AAD2A0M5_9LAMI|nr:unnamed protein product [Fraxinus pennsylvanica]